MTAAAASIRSEDLPSEEAQRIDKLEARPGYIRTVVMPVRNTDGNWVAAKVPVNTVDPSAASDSRARAFHDQQ